MAIGNKFSGLSHIAGRTEDTNRDGSLVSEYIHNMVDTDSGRYDIAATAAGFIMPGGNVVQTGVSLLFNGMAREAEISEAIEHACRNPEVAYAIARETGCDPRHVDTENFARLGVFNRAVRGDMDEAEDDVNFQQGKFLASAGASIAAPWLLGVHGITALATGGVAGIAASMGVDALQQTRKNMTVLGAINLIYAYQCDEQGHYLRNRNNDAHITQAYLVLTRGSKETREMLARRLGWKEGGEETAEQRVATVLEAHLKQRAAGDKSATQLSQALDADTAQPLQQSVNGMLAKDIGDSPQVDAEGRVRMLGERYYALMLDQHNPLTFAQLGLSDLTRLRREQLTAELEEGAHPQAPAQQLAPQRHPAPEHAARPIDPLIQEVARTFHHYGVSAPTVPGYPSPLTHAAGRSSDEPTPAV